MRQFLAALVAFSLLPAAAAAPRVELDTGLLEGVAELFYLFIFVL